MHLDRKVTVLASCLLVAIVVSLAGSSEAVDAPGGEAPGPSTAGTLDIGRWRGRVVLLDFWASWCGPCRESFPWMAEMASRHGAEGLVVVTVNLDQDRDAAERFLEGRRFESEAVYDPEGRVAERWGIESMPASILFDREGSEAFRHMGFRQEEAAVYEAHIRDLLSRGKSEGTAGPTQESRGGSAPAHESRSAATRIQDHASASDRASEQPPTPGAQPAVAAHEAVRGEDPPPIPDHQDSTLQGPAPARERASAQPPAPTPPIADRSAKRESEEGDVSSVGDDAAKREGAKGGTAKRGDLKIGARPWERACLARAAMRFDGAPLDLSFDEHIYFSREASSGGRGFGGGGCGCN